MHLSSAYEFHYILNSVKMIEIHAKNFPLNAILFFKMLYKRLFLIDRNIMEFFCCPDNLIIKAIYTPH